VRGGAQGTAALAASAVALVVGAAGAAQSPAPPVFGVRVETVHVEALVTHAGRALQGLKAADFELKDEGVLQNVELVAAESRPLVCVLVFDASLSVAGPKLAALQAAGAAFLDATRPADEVGLLTFSETIRWQARPSRDRGAVREALGRLQAAGSTAALDALYAALVLPSASGRTLVVLFSDGRDNQSWLDHAQLQAAADRSNSSVHVVGLRPGGSSSGEAVSRTPPPEPAHIAPLRQLAETTGGRYWEAESPQRLENAFAAIAEAIAHRYVLRYEPKGPIRSGWHRIELRLRGRPGNVHARRGYWRAAR
jgi:VWFA-related protein